MYKFPCKLFYSETGDLVKSIVSSVENVNNNM